jgi:hypothetical protein
MAGGVNVFGERQMQVTMTEVSAVVTEAVTNHASLGSGEVGEAGGTRGRRGQARRVYLVRGFVLFIVFVEPNKPKKRDEPDPRHAPRNRKGVKRQA